MKASAKLIHVNHEGVFGSPGLVLSKLLSKHLRSDQFFNTAKDIVKDYVWTPSLTSVCWLVTQPVFCLLAPLCILTSALSVFVMCVDVSVC